MKYRKKGLKAKVWKYFSTFAILILLLMWGFQMVFIGTLYTRMKVNDVEKIGTEITKEFYRDTRRFQSLVTEYSTDGSLLVQVVDEDGKIIYPLTLYDFFSMPTKINPEIVDELFPQIEEDGTSKTLLRPTENGRGNILVYASYLGKLDSGKNAFLFIVTPVEFMDLTTGILQTQFFMITVITLILSTITSFFISEKLVKPIVDLEKSASDLAKGNYDVVFPSADVKEINELASTLNYATDKLSQMDEMRKSIIANISHDLKTPLTVIKSYAEMIRDISGNDEESRNRDLETIISETNDLADMVNNILDVSKLEMEMGEMYITEFDIVELSNKVVDRLKVLQGRDYFKFEIEAIGDTVISADETKIEQVIYNFITNAMNYTGDDNLIKIVVDGSGETLEYSVIDSGEGIPEDEYDNIWTRYYTKNKNHVRQIVGTGLGLYIVKVILESHKFEYGVESEVGVGSRFYFKVNRSSK
ncbi:MAG: HAMP domain-containing histidine kinase [Tissierellia bacterium]|nr:HAMP domain-containing histidine kinase [Tissierellia bacterium]